MKRLKKFSLILSIVFLLQLVISGFLTRTVQAAVEYPLTFTKVESRPVRDAIRYKNKTIVLDYYVNYADQVVDQPIQLIVEADGNKHIISEDVQILRGFEFIGIRDEFAFFVDDYNEGSYVYKVDLNNYTMEKTSESVNSYSNNLNISVDDAVIDTTGSKWFSANHSNWDFRDANGNFIENARAFIVYNSLGKFIPYKISSNVISLYEGVGHITPGNDGDVWFTYSFIKDQTLNTRDNKIIRVTKDGALEEYPINSNYYIDDIRVDKTGNVYIKGTNWIKEGYKMVQKDGMVLHYTINNGSLQHVQDYPVESPYFTDMDLDINDNLWILYGAKTFKLENGTFNLKSYTRSEMKELSVYDDYNMVTFCFNSGYTNITIQDAETDSDASGETGEQIPTSPTEPIPVPQPEPSTQPSTEPTNDNNNNNNNNSNVTNTVPSPEQQPTSDILSNDKISKDTVNELSAVTKDGSAEIKLDAENIKGGQGSLKLNINNLTLELPFKTIDFTGIEQDSYVKIKVSTISNDSILDNINHIGKMFDLTLATYKADGTLIQNIHNFVEGKATVSFKLNNEDIKNLDKSNLAAFYYNESTKTWDLIGGNLNKDTMIFTFETSHFSKYTIAEESKVLPQTGSSFNSIGTVILSIVIIGIGSFLVLKKKIQSN